MKKRILSMAMVAAMAGTLLAGCGSSGSASSGGNGGGSSAQTASASSENSSKNKKSYNVAIVQQMDHASLNEIRKAVEKELDKEAAADNITIKYKEYNGQNDSSTLNQIGSEVVSDKYDMVIPIATMAAQSMQNATEESNTPVVFAAVTDPVSAGLVKSLKKPGGNVTGTSDYLDASAVLDLMLKQNPKVKTVGLLYNKSENSSEEPIKEAKKYLDQKNIKYIEKTGTTTDEIRAAVDSMIDNVDAVFTPTDNTVAQAELAIADKFTKAKVPHYTGADSFVRNGAYATCGVNYTEIGTDTAKMAVKVLRGAKTSTYPVKVMDGNIITVNTDTAKALGYNYNKLKTKGKKLVTVTTTKE